MRSKAALAMLFFVVIALSSIITVPILPLKASGGTQLYIDPPAVNKTPSDVGTNFTVAVTLEDFANLAGFDINLTWDNSLITLTTVEYTTTLNALWVAGNWIIVAYYSGVGFYELVAVALATSASNAGASVLFTLTFQVDTSSTILQSTPIHFALVKLSDNATPVPNPIPATVTDGTYTMSPTSVQVLDVYTQRGGIGPNTPSDAFAPSETVLLDASLQYQLLAPVVGAIVQFITYEPNGFPIVGTGVTGANGIATSNITLPSSPLFGSWTTVASATVNGTNYSDSVTFQVGWIINILQAVTCTSSGSAQTLFAPGTMAYVNITFDCISLYSKPLFALIQATDGSGNPVAFEWIQCAIPPGETAVLMGFRIPSWAVAGPGTVNIVAYNNPPWAQGLFWCLETSVSLFI